jgi:hypothetical protein
MHSRNYALRFGQKLMQTQNDFLHLAQNLRGAASCTPSLLSQLDLTNQKKTTHHMRDGEVVLYLRGEWAFASRMPTVQQLTLHGHPPRERG